MLFRNSSKESAFTASLSHLQSKAQMRLRYWEQTYRRDPLTGLLNHAAFRSDVELKILERTSKIIMLMMDVDKFKEYNDTFGHHNGDKFLIPVAQTLLVSLKNEDRACRMGGDEFAAILFFTEDTPEEQLRERVQQIFDKVNMTIKAADNSTVKWQSKQPLYINQTVYS